MAAPTESPTSPPSSAAGTGASSTPHPQTERASSRAPRAEAIVERNVYWAMGAGVMPLPVVDIAAVTGVEMKMLKELADLYGVEFSPGLAKKIIYSLLVSAGLVGVGSLLGGSLAKIIPVLGSTLGLVTTPVLVGAFTSGLGQVVIRHLEAGGTLQDFDPKEMKTYFKQEFEKSKQSVKNLYKSGRPSPASPANPAAKAP